MAGIGKKLQSDQAREAADHLKIFGLPALLAVAGFVIAYQFVEPAPPRSLEIATGGRDGAYHLFAEGYRELFAREGIDLKLRVTSGSLENLDLLGDPTSGVNVAFVQGGTGAPATVPDLWSLGSLYLEPLWVFHRGSAPLGRLTDLRAKRIAIGPGGSGTRAVTLRLLTDNAMTAEPTQLLPLGGTEAATALKAGEIDAAIYVASPRSPVVRDLLGADGIGLMSFERAKAYTQVHPFLSRVTLAGGAFDFAADIPPRDTDLLAPAATLVARDDLHPALAVLLLQAAEAAHRPGGLFERPDEFPSARFLDFPLSDEARRFYRRGPPFLQRYLPFWAANLVDRLVVMLIPLVTLLIPLMRFLPPVYRWRMRARIYRWYRDLRAVELKLDDPTDETGADVLRSELDRIEGEVTRLTVPLSFRDSAYTLRLHIDMVRAKLASA